MRSPRGWEERNARPHYPAYLRQDPNATSQGRGRTTPRSSARGLARSTARFWPHAKPLLTVGGDHEVLVGRFRLFSVFNRLLGQPPHPLGVLLELLGRLLGALLGRQR